MVGGAVSTTWNNDVHELLRPVDADVATHIEM